mgnify:CR=1 FL=1
MMAASDLPVTVKCRIGIDDMDPETGLDQFVDRVADAGVQIFYLHAREAWLRGLSPKENRAIPTLDYDRARRLAMRRDDLGVILLSRCRSLFSPCSDLFLIFRVILQVQTSFSIVLQSLIISMVNKCSFRWHPVEAFNHLNFFSFDFDLSTFP